MKYVRAILFCFMACVFFTGVAGAQDVIKIGLLGPVDGPGSG